MRVITQAEWDALKRHGYTLVDAAGRRCVLANGGARGTVLEEVEVSG